MQFRNIVGQQEVKQRLLRMVQETRIPHALMLTGPEGSGNLPTAIAFAQYLFCKNPGETDSCGECASCLKVSKLTHPDLHFVFPIAKSKDVKVSDHLIKEFREAFLAQPYFSLNDWFNELDAENKQPIIPTEESSEIIRKLSYTSYEGSYKMMLIWQPEKMNQESANKLLKILEEPPDQTLFLLVCNAPEQLLATIISRVQQIPFYKLSSAEVKDALMNTGVPEAAATQAAIMSDGNYREALQITQHNDGHTAFLQHFQGFMRVALKFDGVKALAWVDENARTGREKQKQFLHYCLEIFRDCLMKNYGNPELIRQSGEEAAFLAKFAPFVHIRNYEKLVEEFNSAYYYVERNANPKILFLDLLLRTNELINQKA